MKIIETVQELKKFVQMCKNSNQTIGLVPTMGYLHEGHISLAAASVRENDVTVMSIFVNPTQFGPNEDYEKYPRDLKKDADKAEKAGVDVIFAPTPGEMYPQGYKTYIGVEEITAKLCGKTRPGHFRGVTTVVAKLFNLVEPRNAYFGQKDAQQVAVIKQMVRDLNMNVNIITCPIVRETDGLAMSSRNTYLSPEERKAALILSKSLQEAENLVKGGERDKAAVLGSIMDRITEEKMAQIDYIEAVNADTLEEIDKIEGKVLIALAVKFGATRLIDNIILEV